LPHESRHMSLAPLLDAAPAVPLHAFATMAAFALGLLAVLPGRLMPAP